MSKNRNVVTFVQSGQSYVTRYLMFLMITVFDAIAEMSSSRIVSNWILGLKGGVNIEAHKLDAVD